MPNRYVRWTVTKRRSSNPAHVHIQMSRFQLRSGGTEVAWPGGTIATNPGGTSPGSEGPDKLIDGLTSTKFLDNSWGDVQVNTSYLVFDVGAGNDLTFDAYSYWTANDADERDPVSWTVEVSDNGTDWTLVDTRTDETITATRQVLAGTWSVEFPSGGPQAVLLGLGVESSSAPELAVITVGQPPSVAVLLDTAVEFDVARPLSIPGVIAGPGTSLLGRATEANVAGFVSPVSPPLPGPSITLPFDTFIDAIHASVTRVTRRVDIYESDGTTPFLLSVGLIDGSVDIDQSRNERRVCDLVLDNEDGSLSASPDGLWYDKVVKVFRGVVAGGSSWEAQLGEFRIDSISSPHFPHVTTLKTRDQTKMLLGSKFAANTIYPRNHPIEEVVRDVAFAGGIQFSQMSLPLTGKSLGRDYIFDREAERWSAIKSISNSYGYEVYFNNLGILTMRLFQDPFTLMPAYTFKTGADGNLVKYDKEATDTFLRNHIVATGESASQIPVWAEAENTNPSSPTSISKVGRRTDFFNLSFIETVPQAEEVAQRFLKVSALEQFNLNLESLAVPYMDVGIVIEFIDPNPNPGDPSRYLTQKMSIPLKLGAMTGTAGRVIQIGS